jgi:hypothetical protein
MRSLRRKRDTSIAIEAASGSSSSSGEGSFRLDNSNDEPMNLGRINGRLVFGISPE